MFAVMMIATSGGCFAAAGAAANPATQQGQAGVTVDQLMHLLAQRKHGTVTYVEEDYLAILDRPVKSSGVLVYDAPDRLEKRTLKPKQESLVLQGDELTVQRGHRTYRVQLNAAYAGRYYLPTVGCEAMYDKRIRASTPGKWVEVI